MLYSREPRSSVCPSSRTLAYGRPARYFACAATMSVPSPLISLLSKSKYTTRFASSPAWGPAVSSSAALAPAAAAALAPEASAPVVASAGGGGGVGLGLLLAHALRPNDAATNMTMIV